MQGILAAIAGPGWLAYLNQRNLAAANDAALQAIRETQTTAIQQRQSYRIAFRELEDSEQYEVQYAAYPATATSPNNVLWQTLSDEVRLIVDDSDTRYNSSEVDIGTRVNNHNFGGSIGTLDYLYIEFDFKGFVNGGVSEQGNLTFVTPQGGSSKRCVFLSTLLGTLRIDSDEGCQAT